MVLHCPLCRSFAATTYKGVLHHLGTVHAHEARFHVQCDFLGCPRTYTITPTKHIFTENIMSFYLAILHQILNLMILLLKLTLGQTIQEIVVLFNR